MPDTPKFENLDVQRLVYDVLFAVATPGGIDGFGVEAGPCGTLRLTLCYRGAEWETGMSVAGVLSERDAVAWVTEFVQKEIAAFVEAERAKVTVSPVSSADPAPIAPRDPPVLSLTRRDPPVLSLTRRDATYGPEPVEYVDVPLISFASAACHPDARVLVDGVGERRVAATETIWSLSAFRLWLKPVDGSASPGPAAEPARELVDGAFYRVRIPLDDGWTVARFFRRRDWAPDNCFLCVGEDGERDYTEIEEIGERVEMPGDEPARYAPVPRPPVGLTSREEADQIAGRKFLGSGGLFCGAIEITDIKVGDTPYDDLVKASGLPEEAAPVPAGIIPFPAHLGGPMLTNALVPPAPAEEVARPEDKPWLAYRKLPR